MPKILVFVPAYNCARQVSRVLAQFVPGVRQFFNCVMVVDNRSTDGTLEAARDALAGWPEDRYFIVRNLENYGLGGSHKVAFNHTLDHGCTHLVVLHGDDQGNITDLMPYIGSGRYLCWEGLLGGRFLRGSKLPGYSALRTFLNYASNALFSAITITRVRDLGAGLNRYRMAALSDRAYLNFTNTLNFNQVLLLSSIHSGHRIRFFPLTWREDEQISNARLLRMGVQLMRIVSDYVLARSALFKCNDGGRPTETYVCERIAGQADLAAPARTTREERSHS